MFERDKDELRAAGIPLETVLYTVNYQETEGYRITRRDFYLPYLRLARAADAGVAADPAGAGEQDARGETAAPTSSYMERARVAEVELPEDDARDALDALADVAALPSYPLRREARSAFRKLAFGMDAELFRPAPVLRADRPGAGTPELTSPAFHPVAREELHAAITHIAGASPCRAREFASPITLPYLAPQLQVVRWPKTASPDTTDTSPCPAAPAPPAAALDRT